MRDGKVILCDHCPCATCSVLSSLVVVDSIPWRVYTDDPQYYRCETLGPFDFNGWIRIEGWVDDDFRIKIGGTEVYSGTALSHNIDELRFDFRAGDEIEIELVEAFYSHNPTGHGGQIDCFFSGFITICPEWISEHEIDEEFV